ncbi:hypothetical protein Q7P37_004776 [Cladosporium fusiforme]
MAHPKFRTSIILCDLLFTLFLAALDFSIITTALPSISSQLRSQTASVWIGSAYLLTSAAVAPVYGTLADIWGRKPALLCAITLLFGGSAICGWSNTVAQIITGRAVQGSGAGGIIVLVNISISDMWSARHRGMFLATTGLVWAVSAGIGPLLGGVFTQYLNWRWVFWINLPCCFAAFVVLYMFLNTTHAQAPSVREGREMDWIGTAAIVNMTILTLLSLDLGGVVFPWDSPKVLSILISGLVLFVVLLNSMPKASPLFVCFTHGIVNVSSWYFLPMYFQAVRGASPVRSGVLLTPIVVVQALVGVGVGGIIYRYGWIRPIIWIGMVLSTLGFGLFITLGATTPLPSLVAFEIIAAVGIGAVFQAPLIAYQAAVDPADMAMATALFGFVRSLSTSISVVVGGVVFQNTIREYGHELSAVLGNQSLAGDFSAANATSSVLIVQTLSSVQQDVVKDAYAAGLREMWKMYAGIAGCGLIAAMFMKKYSLRVPEREDASTVTNSGADVNGIELTRR